MEHNIKYIDLFDEWIEEYHKADNELNDDVLAKLHDMMIKDVNTVYQVVCDTGINIKDTGLQQTFAACYVSYAKMVKVLRMVNKFHKNNMIKKRKIDTSN